MGVGIEKPLSTKQSDEVFPWTPVASGLKAHSALLFLAVGFRQDRNKADGSSRQRGQQCATAKGAAMLEKRQRQRLLPAPATAALAEGPRSAAGVERRIGQT
jgi:hypothetical protein